MNISVKEMAQQIGVSEYKLRKVLIQIGIGVLQNEADRLVHDENFNHPDGTVITMPPPETRHFKTAFSTLAE